jgi:hypothetical protein
MKLRPGAVFRTFAAAVENDNRYLRNVETWPTAVLLRRVVFAWWRERNPTARPSRLLWASSPSWKWLVGITPDPPLRYPRGRTDQSIRSQLLDRTGFIDPPSIWADSRWRLLSHEHGPSRAATERFFRTATVPPAETTDLSTQRTRGRNPLYQKGLRCNYTFGTGTVQFLPRVRQELPCGARGWECECCRFCKISEFAILFAVINAAISSQFSDPPFPIKVVIEPGESGLHKALGPDCEPDSVRGPAAARRKAG